MTIRLLQLLLLLLSFTFSTLAVPLPVNRRDTPTLPSQDTFYQPPQGYESAALGDILAKRQVAVPQAIETLAPGKTQAVWQILYRSQDDAGNPLAVMTTIFVPKNGDSQKFFTQSIAYDSPDVNCSPSYTLRSTNDGGPDSIVIALALISGWYVQSPDYESYKAAFTHGMVSGQTMLDSLRAAKKSSSFTGLSANPRIGLNGGSGGALAIEWALELQPTYAPDVSIAGAALGALTPNVANVMNKVNGGPFAGLIPSGILGMAQGSPDMAAYLNSNLVSSTAADFRSATGRCIDQNQNHYILKDIKTYFQNPNFMTDKIPVDLMKKYGTMGTHGTPQAPVYIYKGKLDEVSPVEDTDALVDTFCNANAPSITYVRNDLTAHFTEGVIGVPGALKWLNDRLNGIAATPGCNRVSESKTSLSSDDLDVLGNLASSLQTALQNAVNQVLSGPLSFLERRL